MEQQSRRACERTKSKQKQNQVTSHSNWQCVLLFDLAHKQCIGIIKGWLRCLTPEAKGRFLANNILMLGSAWCLVMAQIQFSLIKKIKIGRREHSLTPSPAPLRSITYHFCLNPHLPTPLKVDAICVLLLYKFQKYLGNSIKFISRNKEFKFWHLQNFIKEKPYQPKTFDVIFTGVLAINWTIIRLVLNGAK